MTELREDLENACSRLKAGDIEGALNILFSNYLFKLDDAVDELSRKYAEVMAMADKLGKVDELEQKINNLTQELEKVKKNLDNVATQLVETLTKKIDEVNKRIDELSQKLATQQNEEKSSRGGEVEGGEEGEEVSEEGEEAEEATKAVVESGEGGEGGGSGGGGSGEEGGEGGEEGEGEVSEEISIEDLGDIYMRPRAQIPLETDILEYYKLFILRAVKQLRKRGYDVTASDLVKMYPLELFVARTLKFCLEKCLGFKIGLVRVREEEKR